MGRICSLVIRVSKVRKIRAGQARIFAANNKWQGSTKAWPSSKRKTIGRMLLERDSPDGIPLLESNILVLDILRLTLVNAPGWPEAKRVCRLHSRQE